MANSILEKYEVIKTEFRKRLQRMERVEDLIDFLKFDLFGETPLTKEYTNCMYIFNGCFGMEGSEQKFNYLMEILEDIHDNFKFNVDMDFDLNEKDLTITFQNDFLNNFCEYCRSNYNEILDLKKINNKAIMYDIEEMRSPEIFLNIIQYCIGENYIKDNTYRITLTQLCNVYKMRDILEIEQEKSDINDTEGFLYAATTADITNRINKNIYKFGKTKNKIKTRMSGLSVGRIKSESYKCVYCTEKIKSVKRGERILKILAEPFHLENEGEEYYTNFEEITRVFTTTVKINNIIENNINERKMELIKKYEKLKGKYEKNSYLKENLIAIKNMLKKYGLE